MFKLFSNKINMKKLDNLAAMVDATAATTEQISAINAELREANITAVEVQAAGAQANMQATVDDLTARLNAAEQTVATQNDELAQLRAEKNPAPAAPVAHTVDPVNPVAETPAPEKNPVDGEKMAVDMSRQILEAHGLV